MLVMKYLKTFKSNQPTYGWLAYSHINQKKKNKKNVCEVYI